MRKVVGLLGGIVIACAGIYAMRKRKRNTVKSECEFCSMCGECCDNCPFDLCEPAVTENKHDEKCDCMQCRGVQIKRGE